MSTAHFRNAKIFVDGYEISGDSASVSVLITSEMLDETCFGDSTRSHKGGLENATVEASGHWDAAAGRVDRIMFSLVGSDDKIVTVFADGITEGSTTGKGFAMKGVLESYDLTGDVASLLDFSAVVNGRGIEA